MAADTITGEVKRRSTWTMFMGFLIALLGLFLIVYPFAAGAVTTVLLGWILIFVGIAQFVFALHSRSAGKFFLKALMGVLYGLCGIVLAFFPVAGLAALTALLAALLSMYAILLIAIAFQIRPVSGWGWFLADGIASLLVGVLILARWPASSLWAIGTLVGFAVLTSGLTRIFIASGIRGGASAVENVVRHA
jgi:uncharacterized membrane protein HdeD (DUF308 family)